MLFCGIPHFWPNPLFFPTLLLGRLLRFGTKGAFSLRHRGSNAWRRPGHGQFLGESERCTEVGRSAETKPWEVLIYLFFTAI